MKPPPFSVARPTTVGEAVEILASYEDAKVLAGGQSLVPVLNFRIARPSVLVDLSRIEALREIRVEGEEVVIPAMATHADAARSALVRDLCPLLPQAIRYIGHVQIRNRGTVCGSLAHADRAAELCGVALAIDARVTVTSIRGRREIRADELFVGPFTTALDEDELLVEARFPTHVERRTAFVEFARRTGDFAVAGIAAILGDGDASVAAIGVGPTPIRLRQAASALAAGDLDGAAREASREVDPYDDLHADAEHRRELVGVLLRRAAALAAPAHNAW